MEGIYISASGAKLYHIEEAKCCRPQNHPDSYDGCYDEDVTISFDHKGWSQCKQEGYYMAGFYKSGCNELYCIEKFRCCKMKKGNYQKYLACLFTIAADLFMVIKIVAVAIRNLNSCIRRLRPPQGAVKTELSYQSNLMIDDYNCLLLRS